MNKTINLLLAALVLMVFISCEDEIDVDKLTDFAPGIVSISPADGGKVVKGDFDIEVYVADGTSSPLASISVALLDAEGDELYATSKTLSGTSDSIVVAAADFGASTLEVGEYTLSIVVTDSKDQINAVTTTFEISLLPYAASNDVMYISGQFNSWEYVELELVADYTWEIQNIDLEGGTWKLKNTIDWTDLDWGDSDCDGVMEESGPDTDCSFTGLVNIRFNDQTLEYTVESAVTIETNLSALYLLGSFNDFQGTDYAFYSTEDHIWVLDEIELRAGDSFRFSEGAYGGTSFGNNESDSIADESAPNIELADDFPDAIYSITFNDETLEYSFTFVNNLFPSELFLTRGTDEIGWDPEFAVQFVSTGEGYFEMYTYMTAEERFKFLEERSWDVSWGNDSSNDGSLLSDGGSDISVSTDGFYRINVDFIAGTFTVTASNWSILGTATPGQWATDTDMTLLSEEEGNYSWTIDITLTDGLFKFRENYTWDVNYGDNGADGTLDSGGSDISVSAGTYTITMTLDPVNGYTYSIE